jgi:hypothetical protein
MKKGQTLFLRLVIALLAAIVLALSIFALPSAWHGGSTEFPYASASVMLIITGLYVTIIPFFIGLWQGLKLLRLIDHNKAFSADAVEALRTIKRCAGIITIVFFAFVPALFPIADGDDAPGLIIIGGIIACAPMTIAVFAAVLERLFQNAIDIKSENDLTV